MPVTQYRFIIGATKSYNTANQCSPAHTRTLSIQILRKRHSRVLRLLLGKLCKCDTVLLSFCGYYCSSNLLRTSLARLMMCCRVSPSDMSQHSAHTVVHQNAVLISTLTTKYVGKSSAGPYLFSQSSGNGVCRKSCISSTMRTRRRYLFIIFIFLALLVPGFRRAKV